MKEPFTTSDTSLAAYLHYKNHTPLGIMQDPNTQRRKIFVFIKQDDTPEIVEEYNTMEITVHPMGYYKSIRIMHKMLTNGKVIEK